jgi:hypothetical protein
LYPESATGNNQKKYRIPLANIREEELPAEALAKGAGSSMTEQDSFCAFNTTIRFGHFSKKELLRGECSRPLHSVLWVQPLREECQRTNW